MVVIVSALTLAMCGERAVASDATAAIQLARQIFGAAMATASRQSRDHGVVTVTVDPPCGAQQSQRQSIVVLDAPGAVLKHRIQVVESKAGQPLAIDFGLKTRTVNKISVEISVYDARTLTALARLNVIVPPAHPDPSLARILRNALESTKVRRSRK
ncbi:hypothetical protein AB0H12_38405 [Actinosynnema sp. NPDC023794]